MMEHTELPWGVSSSLLLVSGDGKVVANFAPLGVPGITVLMDEAVENCELVRRACNAFPAMEKVCELLAETFPEQGMVDLDAADFTDRAQAIWIAVRKAKAALAAGGEV